jgi:hypothetical protein
MVYPLDLERVDTDSLVLQLFRHIACEKYSIGALEPVEAASNDVNLQLRINACSNREIELV